VFNDLLNKWLSAASTLSLQASLVLRLSSDLCLQGIMNDPCIAADGITYQRSAIEGHLASSNTSPVLGIDLVHSHVTPNHAVRQLTAWLESVGIIEPYSA
jgi:U-box domain